MKNSALCQRLATIPGVGAITATAIVAAVGDAKAFKNGRHLAAWIGLVPRQNSSGGKNRLLGISKRGDGYLRTLLIHGARSVLIRPPERHRSRLALTLAEREGISRALVTGHTIRAIAARIERAPSTVSLAQAFERRNQGP